MRRIASIDRRAIDDRSGPVARRSPVTVSAMPADSHAESASPVTFSEVHDGDRRLPRRRQAGGPTGVPAGSCSRRSIRFDRRDEPIAAPGDRLDEARVAGIVAERLAGARRPPAPARCR